MPMNRPIRRPEEILACRSLLRVLEGKPRAVWSAAPTDSVLAALRQMADRNIGFLVVLERGTMVGVLSERDCARYAARPSKPLDQTPVTDLMVRKVVTAGLTHTFAEALKLMHEHGIRHLPVIDAGTVIAVISIRDLLGEAVAHHAKIIYQLECERLTMFVSPA